MKNVINISRLRAEKWIDESIIDNTVWISIQEPSMLKDEYTTNHILDKLPNLKIAFWDLTKDLVLNNEVFHAPTIEDAQKIINFLIEHKDKNIIINCKAGKCRSGAIAQFCDEYFGHHWIEEGGKNNAVPNKLLFDLMVECANIPKKIIVNDRRRIK